MFGFGPKSIAKQNIRELKETASGHTKAGRWRRALPSLQALVEREPAEPQHRIRLGECFKRLGQSAEARQQWLRAAKVWSADAQWDKASGACRLALAEDPHDLDICHLLNVLQGQRRKTVQRTPRQPQSPEGEPIDLEVEGWGDATRRLEPPPPRVPLAVDLHASSG